MMTCSGKTAVVNLTEGKKKKRKKKKIFAAVKEQRKNPLKPKKNKK